jgi:hypothetical protein
MSHGWRRAKVATYRDVRRGHVTHVRLTANVSIFSGLAYLPRYASFFNIASSLAIATGSGRFRVGWISWASFWSERFGSQLRKLLKAYMYNCHLNTYGRVEAVGQEDLEKRVRETAMRRFGFRTGALTRAAEEARENTFNLVRRRRCFYSPHKTNLWVERR